MAALWADKSFPNSDQALNAAWYEILNLGELSDDQLRGLTAQGLYEAMRADGHAPQITDQRGEELVVDADDHVDAIEAALDKEREDRTRYVAELVRAGSAEREVTDTDRDWHWITDLAHCSALDALEPGYDEPVWCGPECWQPDDQGREVMGGYACGPDKGAGQTAIVICKEGFA